MAEALSERSLPQQRQQEEEEALVLARKRAAESVPRHRFGLMYLLLAALVGATVGLTVVLTNNWVAGDGETPRAAARQWSTWKPAVPGTRGVRAIAQHIGPRYLLDSGRQMAGVAAGPLEFPSPQGPIPITAILISSGKAGVLAERVEVNYPEAGVLYQLCGSGQACSIPGTATAEREQLARREALELALYTYHYLPETDNVLVLLPPPEGTTPQDPTFHRALFLPRSAFRTELAAPLKVTLPPGTTTLTPAQLPADQGALIDGLTAGRTFHYDFQQTGDQSVFVLLAPLPL